MLALTAAIGVVIGLSLGALGGGGSILTVPALVYVLGQDPHAATTGSLIIVGLTSLAGTLAHARAGRVRVGSGVTFGLVGVVGSYVGTRASAAVDPQVLLAGFAVLMLVAAGAMLARRRTAAGTQATGTQATGTQATGTQATGTQATGSGSEPLGRGAGGGSAPVGRGSAGAIPATSAGGGALAVLTTLERPVITLAGGRVSLRCPGPRQAGKVLGAATLVGLLTGFFGVGGGFVVVPALVLALGFSMPTAVGTSLLVISINSAVALLARLGSSSAHGLDWTVLGVFTGAAVVGSVLGNRVASRVRAQRLSLAFVGLLVLVALYTGARSLAHLLG